MKRKKKTPHSIFFSWQLGSRPSHIFYRFAFFLGRHIIWLRSFSLHLWLIFCSCSFLINKRWKCPETMTTFFVHRETVAFFVWVCAVAYLAFSSAFNSFFACCHFCPNIQFRASITGALCRAQQWMKNPSLPSPSIWGIFELFSQSVFFLLLLFIIIHCSFCSFSLCACETGIFSALFSSFFYSKPTNVRLKVFLLEKWRQTFFCVYQSQGN